MSEQDLSKTRKQESALSTVLGDCRIVNRDSLKQTVTTTLSKYTSVRGNLDAIAEEIEREVFGDYKE